MTMLPLQMNQKLPQVGMSMLHKIPMTATVIDVIRDIMPCHLHDHTQNVHKILESCLDLVDCTYSDVWTTQMRGPLAYACIINCFTCMFICKKAGCPLDTIRREVTLTQEQEEFLFSQQVDLRRLIPPQLHKHTEEVHQILDYFVKHYSISPQETNKLIDYAVMFNCPTCLLILEQANLPIPTSLQLFPQKPPIIN